MMRKPAFAGLLLLVSITGCASVANSVGDPLLDELLTAGIHEGAASQCAFSSPPPPTRVLLGAVQIDREELEELVNSSPGSVPGALDPFPIRPEGKIDVCLYQDPAVEDPNVFAIAVYDPSGTGDSAGGVTILNFWSDALVGD